MSTSSAIGYKMSNGKVRAVYCHSDGHIEKNGKILLENYLEARKVAQLIELGDMYALEAELANCVFYDWAKGVKGNTVAITLDSVGDFVANFVPSSDYFYLLTTTGWIVSTGQLNAEDNYPEFDYVETLLLPQAA